MNRKEHAQHARLTHRPFDKSAKSQIDFLIYQPKHNVVGPPKDGLNEKIFEHLKQILKLMDKKVFSILP